MSSSLSSISSSSSALSFSSSSTVLSPDASSPSSSALYLFSSSTAPFNSSAHSFSQSLAFSVDSSLLPLIVVIIALSSAAVIFAALQLTARPWAPSFKNQVPAYKRAALKQGLQLLQTHKLGLLSQTKRITDGLQPLAFAGGNVSSSLQKVAVEENMCDELIPTSDDAYIAELGSFSAQSSLDGTDVSQLTALLEEQKSMYSNFFQTQAEQFAFFYERIALEYEHLRQLLSVKMSVTLNRDQQGLSESIDRLVSGELLARQNTVDMHHKHVQLINTQLFELVSLIRNVTDDYDIKPIKHLMKKVMHDISSLEKLWRNERNRRKGLASHVQIIGRSIIEILANTDRGEESVIDNFLTAFLFFSSAAQELLSKLVVEDLNHATTIEQIDESNTVKRDFEQDRYHLITMKFVREMQSIMSDLEEKLKPLAIPLKQCEDNARVTWIYVQGPLIESRWKEVQEAGSKYGRLFRGINDELAKILTGLLGLKGGLKPDQKTGQLVPVEAFNPSDPFSPIFDHLSCKERHPQDHSRSATTVATSSSNNDRGANFLQSLGAISQATSVAANIASAANSINQIVTSSLIPIPEIQVNLAMGKAEKQIAKPADKISQTASNLSALTAWHEKQTANDERRQLALEMLREKAKHARQQLLDYPSLCDLEKEKLEVLMEHESNQDLLEIESIDDILREMIEADNPSLDAHSALRREVRVLVGKGETNANVVKEFIARAHDEQREHKKSELQYRQNERQAVLAQLLLEVEERVNEMEKLNSAIDEIRGQQNLWRLSSQMSFDMPGKIVSLEEDDSVRDVEISAADFELLAREAKIRAKQRAADIRAHAIALKDIENQATLSAEEKQYQSDKLEENHSIDLKKPDSEYTLHKNNKIKEFETNFLAAKSAGIIVPNVQLENGWLDEAISKLPTSLPDEYLLDLIQCTLDERHHIELAPTAATLSLILLSEGAQSSNEITNDMGCKTQLSELCNKHRQEILAQFKRLFPQRDASIPSPRLLYDPLLIRTHELSQQLIKVARHDENEANKQEKMLRNFSMSSEDKEKAIHSLLVDLASFDDRIAAEQARQEEKFRQKLEQKKQYSSKKAACASVEAQDETPQATNHSNVHVAEEAKLQTDHVQERLEKIESVVRSMREEVSTWRHQTYLDDKDEHDVSFLHRDKLLPAQVKTLPVRSQFLYQHALSLIALLNQLNLIAVPRSSISGHGLPVSTTVNLKIAVTLPKLIDSKANHCTAYRNSFYWESETNCLWLKQERLVEPGELVLVLATSLAHISVLADEELVESKSVLLAQGNVESQHFDDRDPRFQKRLHAILRVITGDLCFAGHGHQLGKDVLLQDLAQSGALNTLVSIEPHSSASLNVSSYAHWPEFGTSRLMTRMGEYRAFAFETSLQKYLQGLELSVRVQREERELAEDYSNGTSAWTHLTSRPNEECLHDELDEMHYDLNRQLCTLISISLEASKSLHELDSCRVTWTAADVRWSQYYQLQRQVRGLTDEKQQLLAKLKMVQDAQELKAGYST